MVYIYIYLTIISNDVILMLPYPHIFIWFFHMVYKIYIYNLYIYISNKMVFLRNFHKALFSSVMICLGKPFLQYWLKQMHLFAISVYNLMTI